MKQFACGDVVPSGPARLRPSKDGPPAEVRSHAREAHGIDEVPRPPVAEVRRRIVIE